MFIKAEEIIGSRTITESGQFLGKVSDFEIDAVSQNIIKYYIKGDFLGFLKGHLAIEANQVVEIKKGEIIVKDAVIQEKIKDKKMSSDIEYAK